MGIVYFIQPAELVGTNHFKIGCSGKDDHSRIDKGYKKGTRKILVFNCDKYLELEKTIISIFDKKFYKIAGNEYYKGNELLMKDEFLNCFKHFNEKQEKNKSIDKILSSQLSNKINNTNTNIENNSYISYRIKRPCSFEKPPQNIEKLTLVLVSNNLLNNRVLLVNPQEKFIDFLRNIYNDLEIDDFTISSRTGSVDIDTDMFRSNLREIFRTDCLDFAVSPFLKTDEDFFNQVESLYKSYELLMKDMNVFKLSTVPTKTLTKSTPVEDTSKNTSKTIPCRLDNHFVVSVGTRKHKNIDIRETIPIINNVQVHENYLGTKSTQNIENIKAYNDYEQTYTDGEVQPFCHDNDITQESSPFSIYSWRAMEDIKKGENMLKCSILYCHSLSMAFIVDKENIGFIPYLTHNFRDFELVKTYDKLSQKELEDCRLYFHKREFETVDILTSKVGSFEILFDIEKDKKQVASKEIELFIRDNYTIDTDPKNILKASTIVENVQLQLRPENKDKLKLSKEISAILLGMGLKKKRMADGIYYYGMTVKPLFGSNDTEEQFQKIVEEHKLKSVRENISTIKA